METKNKKVYECFSSKQAAYLKERGFEFFDEYDHNTTKKHCWKFHMTDELSAALTEWTNSKPPRQ